MPAAESAAQDAEGYISGVVESAAGPEAGVWVIAETDGLGTKLAKIVVTDDDGRFVLPQLPDATYDVWVRGYGLVDSGKVQLAPAARRRRAGSRHGARRGGRGGVLPRELLVLADRAARPERVSGHRARGQRHLAGDEEPSGVGRQHEAGLPALPSARQHRDARGATPGRLRLRRGGVGPPRADGAARQPDERRDGSLRPRARRLHVRRLDGPDRRRRAAPAAPAAERRRAQPSRDAVGLGHRQLLHPRRDYDRQAQPHPQRRRAGVRRLGRARHADRRRSEREHRRRAQDSGAPGRPGQRDVPLPADAGRAFLLLGRATAVGARRSRRPRERLRPAQSDDGRRRARVDDVEGAQPAQPRLVPGGLVQQVRRVLADRRERPAGVVLRPRDRRVRADRHLLRHAPPAVRRGRQRHALVQWGRQHHRLD